MIEINLLPAEFKVKIVKKKSGVSVAPQYIFYAIPVLVAVVFFLHLLLGAISLVKSVQLRALNNTWQKLEPQRKSLEKERRISQGAYADYRLVQKLLGSRVCWAQKMNRLSLNLPAGVWFREIEVNDKELTVKASAVSLKKEEIGLINRFMDALRKDEGFSKDFTILELGPLKRRAISGYDVVDFTLLCVLKRK